MNEVLCRELNKRRPDHFVGPVDNARLKQLLLGAFPLLAALGPFASIAPGSSDFPYFYRLLLVCAAVPAVRALSRHNGIRSRVLKWYLALTAIFCVWGPVTLLWNPNADSGRREVIGIALSLIGGLFALSLTEGRKGGIETLRLGFVVAFIAVAMIGAAEAITGIHLFPLVGIPWLFPQTTIAATFNNPNDYAVFLVACLGPILTGAIEGKTRGTRVAHGALYLLAIQMIFLTNSRSGVLGAGIVTLIALLWVARRGFFLMLLTLAKFAFVTGTIMVVVQVMQPARDLTLQILAPFEKQSTQADNLRWNLTVSGWRYFQDSPWLGTGAGSFREMLAFRDNTSITSGAVTASHNAYLQMIAQYGILIAIPLTALTIGLFFWATIYLRQSPALAEARNLQIQTMFGLTAIVTGCLAESSAFSQPTWWLVIAYVVSLVWSLSNEVDGSRRSARETVAPDKPATPVSSISLIEPAWHLRTSTLSRDYRLGSKR